MGGRGSSSGAKGGAAGGIPRLNNPAGIPSNAITEEEFLTLRGVGDSVSGAGIDMIGGANMTRMSEKQRNKVRSEIAAQADVYYDKRRQARNEYKQLVESGKIRDKTSIEKMITRAHGNPELSATQAARRMAEKHGYDWKTGKKL